MSALSYGSSRQNAVFRGWDRFDYFILIASIGLAGLGLLLIYSGSAGTYTGPIASFANPVTKQAIFAILGIGLMLLVSKIDYHYLIHYSWILYIIGLLSLVAILFVGTNVGGSVRWFNIGPLQVQPSEFAKLATILLLARFFSEHGGDAKDLKTLLISLAIVVPAVALVFIEPDLGTSIVFMAIWLGVVIVAGVSRSHLLVMAALFVAAFPFVWTFAVADYRSNASPSSSTPTRTKMGSAPVTTTSRPKSPSAPARSGARAGATAIRRSSATSRCPRATSSLASSAKKAASPAPCSSSGSSCCCSCVASALPRSQAIPPVSSWLWG